MLVVKRSKYWHYQGRTLTRKQLKQVPPLMGHFLKTPEGRFCPQQSGETAEDDTEGTTAAACQHRDANLSASEVGAHIRLI